MGDHSEPARESLVERVEHAIEDAANAVRDRARAAELGLLQGDHTPIGELAGVTTELVHPEGVEDEEEPPAGRG